MFFAALSGLLAWLKSGQYHDHGQLSQERWETVFFIALSGICVLIVLPGLGRYSSGRRSRLVLSLLCCGFAAACVALAIYNLRTATIGAKDTLF
jgi:hypothetical protein